MVGLVQKVVVILTMTAALLGTTAAALPGVIPDAIPTTVPALCVQLPLLGAGVQAGYCP
jgi:hypothetical protein